MLPTGAHDDSNVGIRAVGVARGAEDADRVVDQGPDGRLQGLQPHNILAAHDSSSFSVRTPFVAAGRRADIMGKTKLQLSCKGYRELVHRNRPINALSQALLIVSWS